MMGVRHVPRGAPLLDDGVAVRLSTIGAPNRVHHRASEARAVTCWQLVQLHVSPQPQTSPH